MLSGPSVKKNVARSAVLRERLEQPRHALARAAKRVDVDA
jgi:hypothetical protein